MLGLPYLFPEVGHLAANLNSDGARETLFVARIFNAIFFVDINKICISNLVHFGIKLKLFYTTGTHKLTTDTGHGALV